MNYEVELVRLYSQQSAAATDGYLHAHSRNRAVIRRQVEVFQRYERYLKDAAVVLDWGCRRAPDACMARMALGEKVTIKGCDIDEASYGVFFDYAKVGYSRLDHPWVLPYENDTFDVVIGSGVLEHVPNDSESLKELYRVIRTEGYLIITMLPNHLSYTSGLTVAWETLITFGSIHCVRYDTFSCTMDFAPSIAVTSNWSRRFPVRKEAYSIRRG